MLAADLAVLAVFDPRVAQRARIRLHVLASMDGSTPGGRLVLAARARDLLFRGLDRDQTVSAAQRALSRGGLAAESSVWIAWSYAVNSLIVADRGDLALEEIDRLLDDLVARAAVGWYCVARTLRADAQLRAGRVRSALADATGALEAASDHGLSTLPAAAANLAAALLEHDQLDESDQVMRTHGLYEPLPEHVLFFPPLYTRGCIRLARGETEAAVDDLFEVGAREDRWDIAQPCGYPWRVAAVRGLLRLGRGAEAEPLAREQARLGETWRCPRSRALGELALGLVEPRERAGERFRRAAGEAAGEAPLLQLEALIELGRNLRQQGERTLARVPLREAYESAHSLSALRLAREAEEELRAARGRPPKRASTDDELTPSERRIARLAAAGTSNREIAATSFLSVRTVETHLTSAYRRLGIASRRELPEALAQRPGELAEPAAP
jgi:DNA-binding CsgD family transcriptional regulator